MAWEGIVGALVAKQYGKDLTRLAGRGKLDPQIAWDDEVRQCIQILSKMGKHSPIIMCDPGVAKTTIAERLAQRIVQGDVPDRLLNRKLIYLDMETFIACTNYEKMLKVVSKEATSSNGQTILFIDLVGAGATSGAMDAACYLFKTMFRQGKLQCVVATTAEEYREYIEKDCVLARSFQQVLCPQPTVNIGVSNLQPEEREKLLRLEDCLKQRVVGQDMAVESVANAILDSRLGLSDPNRPLASFMFMGSTGVGKTELAKTLADYLFNTENALVTMDIRNCRYEGALARFFHRRPYSVIVFEWIEEAHDDALNILIRIMKNGKINDYEGRTASFKNSVIIMTTNIASHLILNTKEVSYDIMKKQVVDLARQKFRSRFMDCIDEYVVFKSFDCDDISNIVEMQMRLLKEMLKKQNNIELHYSKEAIEMLAKLSFKPNSGARLVNRVIQTLVVQKIATGIVRGDIKENETVLVDVDENSDLPPRERLPGESLRVRKLERDSSIEAIKESSFLVGHKCTAPCCRS